MDVVFIVILYEEAIAEVPELVGHLASQSARGESPTGGGEASLEQRPFLGGHLVERIELRAVILLLALHHGHGAVAVLSDRVDGPGVIAGHRGCKRRDGVALAVALAVAHRWHEGHMAVAVFGAANV